MIDYDYKTDNQIIMLALSEFFSPGNTGEATQIAKELLKRGTEQKMHIPYHVRKEWGEGK